MNEINIKWELLLKPLDQFGQSSIHKVRCCVRGDYQIEDFDEDPFCTYAPVDFHEAVRVMFAYMTSNYLVVKGGDVANACIRSN